MIHIFNFTQTTVTGTSFNFGDTGSGPYYDFNFMESGYIPSYDFTFGKAVEIYNILKGTSNNFSSVWVFNNKMYVGEEGYLTTVDLSTNTVYDWYSTVHIGRANESLNSQDINDVNVV